MAGTARLWHGRALQVVEEFTQSEMPGRNSHIPVPSSLSGVMGELADALAGGVEYGVGDCRGYPCGAQLADAFGA